MKHHIGVIGLGKMGQNIVVQLLEQGINVTVYNRTASTTEQFVHGIETYRTHHQQESEEIGIGTLQSSSSIQEFVSTLPEQRIILFMVKAGTAVDEVISQLVQQGIQAGDTLIDAGNSFYEDTKRRYKELSEKNITYIDCGTSGGLEGARYGACLMLGGDKEQVETLSWLWDALSGKTAEIHKELCCESCNKEGESTCNCDESCECCSSSHYDNEIDEEDVCDASCYELEGTWTYFGPTGAGHFVKMVHNGVEYGIDQAIGEGFHLLKESPYQLNLPDIAHNWSHGSVVRGWLIELLARALKKDPQLSAYKGSVGGGETGQWTVATAKTMGVPQPIIEQSLQARTESQTHPTFAGKVVSALRFEYGGHKE